MANRRYFLDKRALKDLYRMLMKKQIVSKYRSRFMFLVRLLSQMFDFVNFAFFPKIEVIFAIARGQFSGFYSKISRNFSILFVIVTKNG